MKKIEEIFLADWIRCILDLNFDERHVPEFKEKVAMLKAILPQIPDGLPDKYVEIIRKVRKDILVEAGVEQWADAIRFSLHPYHWSGIWKVIDIKVADDGIIKIWFDWGGYINPGDTFDFKHQFTEYVKLHVVKLIATLEKIGLEVEIFIASDEYDPGNSDDYPYWTKL